MAVCESVRAARPSPFVGSRLNPCAVAQSPRLVDAQAISKQGVDMKRELMAQGVLLLHRMPDIPDEVAAWFTGKDRPAHLKGRLENQAGEGLIFHVYHLGVLAHEMKNRILSDAVSRWLTIQQRDEADKLIMVGPPGWTARSSS